MDYQSDKSCAADFFRQSPSQGCFEKRSWPQDAGKPAKNGGINERSCVEVLKNGDMVLNRFPGTIPTVKACSLI